MSISSKIEQARERKKRSKERLEAIKNTKAAFETYDVVDVNEKHNPEEISGTGYFVYREFLLFLKTVAKYKWSLLYQLIPFAGIFVAKVFEYMNEDFIVVTKREKKKKRKIVQQEQEETDGFDLFADENEKKDDVTSSKDGGSKKDTARSKTSTESGAKDGSQKNLDETGDLGGDDEFPAFPPPNPAREAAEWNPFDCIHQKKEESKFRAFLRNQILDRVLVRT